MTPECDHPAVTMSGYCALCSRYLYDEETVERLEQLWNLPPNDGSAP